MAHGSHEYTGAIPAASVVRTWGTLPDERRADYPCDALLPGPDDILPAGDLVMMRKQLLTLKRLTEGGGPPAR